MCMILICSWKKLLKHMWNMPSMLQKLSPYTSYTFFFFLNSRKPQFLRKAASKTSAVRSQTLCHDMFFLKTRERSVRNLWIILKKRKFTIITKVVWKVSRFCFARGEKRTHPSHLKTKMGHGKTLFLCSVESIY